VTVSIPRALAGAVVIVLIVRAMLNAKRRRTSARVWAAARDAR